MMNLLSYPQADKRGRYLNKNKKTPKARRKKLINKMEWDSTKSIPADTPKTSRIAVEGAWGGASWDGILNVGMYIFKKRYESQNYELFVIKSYTPRWRVIAHQERKILKKTLSKFSWFRDVQHIGSTSIFGMSAKPIIDLMLGASDSSTFSEAHDQLILLGWQHLKDSFYSKDNNLNYGVSLYVCEYKGLCWNCRILFRDYFIQHPGEVKVYSNLKTNLKRLGLSFDEYVIEKQKYIYKVLVAQGLTIEEMKIGNAIFRHPEDIGINLPTNFYLNYRDTHL